MGALTFLARRFVAGENAREAIEAVRELNKKGIKATLDFLGEEVHSEGQAEAATREIAGLFGLISSAKADCNVSLKLTQLGLAIDPKLARKNLERILDMAAEYENFVRIDMEGSPYTQKTLDLFRDVFQKRKNVGVVIQAYLRRSEGDVLEMIKLGARVRLCKGAYKEPPDIAFPDKAEVNRNYDHLAQLLIKDGVNPAIATHDDARIEGAMSFAEKIGRNKNSFEFQMLYGLRRAKWTELASKGYPVRIYVPYGTHWMPYYYRRLRERKENVLFVVKNLLWG